MVAFGLLNVCLGFGLAMYLGHAPPDLQGIFDSLGPMPAVTLGVAPNSVELGAPYVPPQDPETPPSAAGESAAQPFDPTEENVLGEVQELATAAQGVLVSGEVGSHE
jgi:hypothetical protein